MSEHEGIYSSDAPVNHPENDVFQRWPFAQRVAQVIASRKNKDSIVIGIDGVWGEGKTSVLNFIRHELQNHSHIVCMKFNPWRFGDEEQLLRGFFFDLAKSVDQSLSTSTEKIGDFLKRFAQPVGAVVGQGEVVTSIGDMLGSADIEKLRQRIEKILDDQDRRVVILVDDIDRLEKNEIHAIFRLIKLTADFRNTAYVLAFDHEMVASALQDRFGSELGAGKDFLEKIIQVPLKLPEASKDSLRKYCFDGIDIALAQAGVKLDDSDVLLFVRNFTWELQKRLKTPRQATLYVNILTFSIPILKGEVNYVDLMLIEGIRIFYPSLYNIIRSNQTLLLKQVRDRENNILDKHKKEVKSLFSKSLESLNKDEAEAALELLKYLFPQLEAVYGNTHYSASYKDSWAISKRICSSLYFARYFSYTILIDDVSDQLITEFIEKSSVINVSNTVNELIKIMNPRNTEAIFSKITQNLASISDQGAKTIAIALASSAKLIPNVESYGSLFTPFSQAAMLVSDLVSKIPADSRISVAIETVSIAEPITFGVEYLRWIRTHTEEKPDPRGFKSHEIDVIGGKLAEKISTFEGGLSSLFNEFDSRVASLLNTWSKYGKEGEVNERINLWLDEEPNNAMQLLLSYLPTEWDIDSGVPKIESFKIDHYKLVNKVVDPEMIMRALNKIYQGLDNVRYYPIFIETTLQLLTAKQFSWVHKNVQQIDGDTKQEDIQEM
ncbi:P-loop NTPase fold protein [Paenibacillus xylanexedens]|uniref:KAP family P-loop NTPase fold protein n=1 Tax=Paenibacillus xylanexedens TaxID=528191 RepID=UPI001642965B|nr:P-loop NTPase fold protein [Paenibacillus xylanexedens]